MLDCVTVTHFFVGVGRRKSVPGWGFESSEQAKRSGLFKHYGDGEMSTVETHKSSFKRTGREGKRIMNGIWKVER